MSEAIEGKCRLPYIEYIEYIETLIASNSRLLYTSSGFLPLRRTQLYGASYWSSNVMLNTARGSLRREFGLRSHL